MQSYIYSNLNSFFETNDISELRKLINILLDTISKKPAFVEGYIFLSIAYFIIDENQVSIRCLNLAKRLKSNDKFIEKWNNFLNENINKIYSKEDYIFEYLLREVTSNKDKIIVNKLKRIK